MGRNSSEYPVRVHVSPPRRSSPLRRDRSPDRHRGSNTENLSSRNRSPKRGRSRSPGPHSPVRDKSSGRTKSPKYKRSPSPASRSPVGQKKSSQVSSQKFVKSRSPLHLSPMKNKPPSRTRSPKRVNSTSSVSPRTARSKSPVTRSPSPLTKRLKAARAERNTGKGNEREYERNQGRKLDRPRHEERDLESDVPTERRDRGPESDASRNGSRSGHGHSVSPSDRNRRGQRRSRSPYGTDSRGRDELSNPRDEDQRNGDSDSLAKMRAAEEKLEAKENKQEPSFALSGKLAAETIPQNTSLVTKKQGVTLLFNEPPDARKPDVRWRLYVFKAGEVLNEPLYIHRQSCYLFGRERRVADIPTDHPSCSKQHAVLQYRQVDVEKPDGMMTKKVRPYLMDLGSTNGTFINENQIEPQRYYELFEKDTVKFGNSSREYVILHENSAT